MSKFKAAAIQAAAAENPSSDKLTSNEQEPKNAFSNIVTKAMEAKTWRSRLSSLLRDKTKFGDDDSGEMQFQAIFHTEKNEPSDQVLRDLETQEENLWDVVDQDDEAIEEYASNELMGNLLSNKYFRSAILAAILANSLLIVVETDQELERRYKHLFSVLDQCLMTVFVCEILFKWYHGFFMFWKMGWNILDFFIVVALLLGPLLTGSGSGSRGVLRILRVLRAFRSLRSITSLPGLQIVVQTILQSIPDMANIVLLLVIIMLVFSVIGITLFRDSIPEHFSNLSTAMFSLFICLTMDGWIKLNETFLASGGMTYVGGTLYLNTFIAIGAFVFANLVVAVVVTNLEFAMVDVKTEERHGHEHEILLGKYENDKDITTPITKADNVSPHVLFNQKPYQLPEMNDINTRTEELENFFLILAAFEDNLAQYMNIKNQIIEIFGCICDLHKRARLEGMLREADEARAAGENARDKVLNLEGDILSNLIELEENKMISSKRRSLDNLIRGGATALSSTTSHNNIPASIILPAKPSPHSQNK
ncbi:cation channel sperm-associated protein 4-like [Dendronephthya gigantea]|uniref:cation channel sperm-associated protein 4-like n=1 Tax=Dendronephthya gigantea TaxID=151771 RepID=UPI00106C18D2|nr:cation channel sperm-associated protein 4-like [Dendronephthya gigantea]